MQNDNLDDERDEEAVVGIVSFPLMDESNMGLAGQKSLISHLSDSNSYESLFEREKYHIVVTPWPRCTKKFPQTIFLFVRLIILFMFTVFPLKQQQHLNPFSFSSVALPLLCPPP